MSGESGGMSTSVPHRVQLRMVYSKTICAVWGLFDRRLEGAGWYEHVLQVGVILVAVVVSKV